MRIEFMIFIFFGFLLVLTSIVGQQTAPPAAPAPGTEEPAPLEYPAISATALEEIVKPEEYVLGPGDILRINILGLQPVTYSNIAVSPSGKAFVPVVGELEANSLTLKQFSDNLYEELAKKYKDFELSVLIDAFRQIKVYVLGEVPRPGVKTITSLTRVAELLSLAGGISSAGSRRNIKVIRDDEEFLTVDLDEILIRGDVSKNIRMEAGDIVYVPIVGRVVNLQGEVKRSGSYELKEDEGLKDIIAYAGGLTPQAAAREAKIERIKSNEKKEVVSIDLRQLLAGGNPDDDWELQDGDTIEVPSVNIVQNTIKIAGEVVGKGLFGTSGGEVKGEGGVEAEKSGRYILREGERLKDVIIAVGGVTAQADLENAWVARAEPGGGQEIIPIDLYKLVIKNDSSQNIELQNGDMLVVPRLKDKVYVMGQVKNPGAFVFRENRRISEYVGEAGGPTGRAKLKSAAVIRGNPMAKPQIIKVNLKEVIRGGNTKEDLVLQAGDMVYVPEYEIAGWQDLVAIIYGLKTLLPSVVGIWE